MLCFAGFLALIEFIIPNQVQFVQNYFKPALKKHFFQQKKQLGVSVVNSQRLFCSPKTAIKC